jgi:CYTH domain-containing protein
MSSKRLGKYACLELERRYLLRELPADLEEQGNCWHITDRYIADTRLRLRRMEMAQGGKIVFKFGQKYRGSSQSRGETTMTNMYLNDEEYHCLSKLDAREIIKRRYKYVHDELEYGIDVFEGELEGLIMAEIECETEQEFERLRVPSFALKEVTGEEFFTGGNLAATTRGEFEAGLASWLCE